MADTTQPANDNHASKFVNADEEIEETELMLYDKEKQHLKPTTAWTERGIWLRGGQEALKNEMCKYLPLHKAVLRGDWECAKRIFDADEGALTARITPAMSTALHIAVGTGKALHFVKKLVDLMPVEALALLNNAGDTALHHAAVVGNTKAAVILVKKHPALLYIGDKTNAFPIHLAAEYVHKDTLEYFLKALTGDHPVSLPFSDQSGLRLLIDVIRPGFYDVALNLIRRYPKIATTKLHTGLGALDAIAAQESAFASGSRLNSWQRFIYSCKFLLSWNPTDLSSFVSPNYLLRFRAML